MSGAYRKFRFFTEDPPGATAPHNVTAAASAAGVLWLTSADGSVAALDHDLSTRASFTAHAGPVLALAWAKGKVVTVGQDGEGLRGLHLKAWAVEGLLAGGGAGGAAAAPPLLSSPLRLFPGKLPAEGGPTAVALHAADWPAVTLAVGLPTGATVVLRGDASRSKLPPAFPLLPPPPTAPGGDGGGSGAVSGVHLVPQGAAGEGAASAAAAAGGGAGGAAPAAAPSPAALHMYVVWPGRAAAYEAKAGGLLWVDDAGSSAGGSAGDGGGGAAAAVEPAISAVTPGGELLVAGPDAISVYSAEEGRKAAFAVAGRKQLLAAVRHYVVVAVAAAAAAAAGGGGGDGSGAVELRVLDLSNKARERVAAASAAVPSPPLRWAEYYRGALCAGDSAGNVIRLREKSLGEKLEALYRSRSYQLALGVAGAEGADAATMAAVRRHYGDFLYAKRDYEPAMEQYAATIGCLEPSYVIQRFLDVQRLASLTGYLEALHSKGAATGDHTTLLLNCYTKLKAVEKLDAFIQGDGRMSPDALHFDVDTAIRVCRSAGYFEHALYVALAAGRPQTYLEARGGQGGDSVLVEDCGRCGEGLEFARGLPREQAAAALRRYGRALLEAVPVEATALLMELCIPDPSGRDPFVASLADFTHLFVDRPDDLRYACVTILNMAPDCPSHNTLYLTLLDLYLSDASPTASDGTGSGPAAAAGGGGSRAGSPGPSVAAPSAVPTSSPTPAAGESSAAAAAGAAAAAAAGPDEASRREALELLRRGWPGGQEPRYDVQRALVVCRLHGFSPGLLFLYERLRLYREAAGVLMESGDWDGLISTCEAHGDARTGGDPQLWHDALRYFRRVGAQQRADCSWHVQQVLQRIEAGNLLPPLVVLQVLSQNPAFKLSLVKGYVTRQLQAENRAIKADAEEAEHLAGEVGRAREALARLQTEPVVFQASRDSQTSVPLELPSVHFLCGHSFNLRTLGDSDAPPQCPLCAAEQRKTQDLVASNKASAADCNAFFKQLRAAPDGFAVVADFFGRGLLNHTSVTTD
eukprot:scaffold14.g1223.t1